MRGLRQAQLRRPQRVEGQQQDEAPLAPQPAARPRARERGGPAHPHLHGLPQGEQGPEGVARLRVGTSGFAYPGWKPAFYPPDLPASRFLEFYAGRFDTVELNSTFYRFPSERQLADWRDRTPAGFAFALKANQRITHFARLTGEAPRIAAEFVDRCRLLGPKLGPILFGLPPRAERDDERLGRFLEALPRGVRYAFEFRHPGWLAPEVLAILRAAGAALCLAETEEASPPREATAGFVYVRLRRTAYADPELADWRRWLDAQASAGREAFVYVKHDEAGAGPAIGRRLLAADGPPAGGAEARAPAGTGAAGRPPHS